MTDKQFSTLWADALEANNRDAYASDWALSSMWGEDADIMELNEICGRVWDVAHMTVADIRNHTGLTQKNFAMRFCIPERTLTNWEYRGGVAPYIRLMLAQECGLLKGIRETECE